MAYTTLAVLKEHLGIESSDTSEDDFLNQLIPEIEDALTTRFGRQLASTVYATEYQSGDGTEVLQLNQRPVTAISAVSVDQKGYWGHGTDAFPSSSLLTLGTDFAPVTYAEDENTNFGQIHKLSGYWAEGKGNIKIAYTAGYTTIPPQVELLCNQLCALVRNSAEYGGLVESGKVGDEAFVLLGKSTDGSPWAVEAMNLISGFQRITI